MNMKTRHESREQAFVLLFEKTVNDDPMEDIVEMAVEARGIEMDAYCEKLTALAELYLEQIEMCIRDRPYCSASTCPATTSAPISTR